MMQGKGKFVHFQVMMAYRVSRCIAPLILNLGTRRWVVTIFYKIFMSIIIGCCLFCGWMEKMCGHWEQGSAIVFYRLKRVLILGLHRCSKSY